MDDLSLDFRPAATMLQSGIKRLPLSESIMRYMMLSAAVLGAASLATIAQAAEHSTKLGDLQADYVVAPGVDGSFTKDVVDASPKIDPRELLGPSKAVVVRGRLPEAVTK